MNLTALQHSAFLQSLGWAIANSLWQAAALWLLYILVNGIYREGSAKFKNNFSTLLLLSAFVWFTVTLFDKYFQVSNQTVTYVRGLAIDNIVPASSANKIWNDLLARLTATLPYLSVAYLLLLVVLAAKLVKSWHYIYFIRVSGLQKAGVEWRLFTEKVAKQMGISKKIKIWVSKHIDVPATIGFIKPVILIPLASINQLTAEQMEAIILHELSHIKRNDYLVNILISLIETILFFNPFIVLISKVIKRERENCCDDFVIQYQYDRYSYASALLSLEQSRNTNLRLAIAATSGKKQLFNRIKRIMEAGGPNTNFNYGQKLFALLIVTGIICSIAWLSPQKKESKEFHANTVSQKAKKKTHPVVKEPSTQENNTTVYTLSPKQVAKKVETRNDKLFATTEGNDDHSNNLVKFNNNNFLTTSSDKDEVVPTLQPTVADAFSMISSETFSTVTNLPAVREQLRKDLEKKRNSAKDVERLKTNKNGNFYFTYDANNLQQQFQEKFKDLYGYFSDEESHNKAVEAEKLVSEARAKQNIHEIHGRMNLPQTWSTNIQKAPKLLIDSFMSKVKVFVNKETEAQNMLITQSANGKVFRVGQPGFIYRFKKEQNDDPCKIKLPKKGVAQSVTLEYKNGVIVINGNLIDLPEETKLIAPRRSHQAIGSDRNKEMELNMNMDD